MNLVLIYFLIKSLNPKAHVSCLPADLSVTWRWVSAACEAECNSLNPKAHVTCLPPDLSVPWIWVCTASVVECLIFTPYNIHGCLSFPVNKADHSIKLKAGIYGKPISGRGHIHCCRWGIG